MSLHSKANKPIVKRQFALRFTLETEVEQVSSMIDLVNEALAEHPGQGYIDPRPEIEMEGMSATEVYYLYADLECWESFLNRKSSFMPSIELQLNSQYEVMQHFAS